MQHQPMSSALDRQHAHAQSSASRTADRLDPDIIAFIDLQTDMHVKMHIDMARASIMEDIYSYRE